MAELKILIIVPHYWGKGKTITEAWNQVKKSSYKGIRELKNGPWRTYVTWDTEKVKTYVDELGSIVYPCGHHCVKIDENAKFSE